MAPKPLVLRRQVKRAAEVSLADLEASIHLTKKAPREEGSTQKVLDASTSHPSPLPQIHEECEQESEEDQDEVTHYLNEMLKVMEKVGQANDKKNAQYEHLMQVSLSQQNTQEELLKYANDLAAKVAIKESLFEAEEKRSNELSERLNQALQRAIKAEKELQDSKDELATQKLYTEQMRLALQTANQRRVAAEDELDRLLTNPILSASKPSTSDEASKREHLELMDMLKAKERQLGMVTEMFFQKEQELQKQLKELQ